MAKAIDIDRCELKELITRLQYAIDNDLSLTSEDMKLLLAAINTLCEVHDRLEQDDITLNKLKKLLGMIAASEAKKNTNKNNKSGKKKSHKNKSFANNKEAPPKTVTHNITTNNKGDVCPSCNSGKLCKYNPGILLRITGHAPFEAKKHIREQLRCNACQEIVKASLPQEVLDDGDESQTYGYSARTLMVLNKFYSGLPYHHQGNVSNLFGCSITASTIFDQCQHVANAVEPIFNELKLLAANAVNLDIDDTRSRIIEQKPELRDKRNGKGQQIRSGVYTSGLVATLAGSQEIILYETSLGHAGEHLDDILSNRSVSLDLPIIMSDALGSNSSKYPIEDCYCNAHCRRNFFDLEKYYPEEISFILETYAVIWINEGTIKEQGLSKQERQIYHNKHSLPVMEKLKEWAELQVERQDFEENNSYGKAVKYLLKHYKKLTKFCTVIGAKIDNNRVEERLKLAIRSRKTSYFYKTTNGANVSNILTSIIATSDVAGVNLFEYFQVLQRHRVAVKSNPRAWLPWAYEQTLLEQQKDIPPDKKAA